MESGVTKWRWMMKYCEDHKLSPADFWGEAENAYTKTYGNDAYSVANDNALKRKI